MKLGSLANALFSLFSLNSLYSLLPYGYRFRYPRERRITLCWFVAPFLLLGIVFDACEGVGVIVGLIKVIASQFIMLRGDSRIFIE